MRYWTTALMSLAVSGVLTSPVVRSAQDTQTYYETAEVVDVVPIVSYERVATPHRECSLDRARYRRTRDRRDGRDSPMSSVVGGLLGGAIGHQFGSGNGKKAMTVAGAIVGASIAGRSRHNSDRRQRYVREGGHTKCRTTQVFTETERTEGYRVTYRYLGEEFEKTTAEHPGESVRIHVHMTPILDEQVSYVDPQI